MTDYVDPRFESLPLPAGGYPGVIEEITIVDPNSADSSSFNLPDNRPWVSSVKLSRLAKHKIRLDLGRTVFYYSRTAPLHLEGTRVIAYLEVKTLPDSFVAVNHVNTIVPAGPK